MNKKVASCFYCNIWNRYKRDKKIKLLILNCSLPGLPLGCLDLSPVLLTLPWLYTSKGDFLCFLTRLLGDCPVPGVSGESPGAAALWSLSGEGVERQSCCSPWGGDCRAWPSRACDLCEHRVLLHLQTLKLNLQNAHISTQTSFLCHLRMLFTPY